MYKCQVDRYLELCAEKIKNSLISGEVEIIQHLFVELRVINFIKGYSASVGCHN